VPCGHNRHAKIDKKLSGSEIGAFDNLVPQVIFFAFSMIILVNGAMLMASPFGLR